MGRIYCPSLTFILLDRCTNLFNIYSIVISHIMFVSYCNKIDQHHHQTVLQHLARPPPLPLLVQLLFYKSARYCATCIYTFDVYFMWCMGVQKAITRLFVGVMFKLHRIGEDYLVFVVGGLVSFGMVERLS